MRSPADAARCVVDHDRPAAPGSIPVAVRSTFAARRPIAYHGRSGTAHAAPAHDPGGVPERLKGTVLKTVRRESASGVRIPPPPFPPAPIRRERTQQASCARAVRTNRPEPFSESRPRRSSATPGR